jgi:2-iminoacetate synthase
LVDYAAEPTRKAGDALIETEMSRIPKEKVRDIVRRNLAGIEQGQRDFRL